MRRYGQRGGECACLAWYGYLTFAAAAMRI